jgi:CubicO group peptidase (beta-lactamase class C family)
MDDISGYTASGFETVREEFERNFIERGETGASLAVMHRGEIVVDLHGGTRDGSQPWDRDTIVLTYSTTKPLVASCAVLLWDRGELELDAPVASYWPEFGQTGKAAVTVRQLLTHQAGLVALRKDLAPEALFDRAVVIAALEEEEPWWPPGTRSGEHAFFYGHLIDELVRRVDGRSLRAFFAEEIAEPWAVDFHIGLDDEDLERAAMVNGMERAWPGALIGEEGSLMRRALTNPPGALDPNVVNSERWKRAEVPAINGYGTAMGLARFYQGFLAGGELDGTRVFSDKACGEAITVHCSGEDLLLERHVDWGFGFQIEDGYFGHGGIGGASAYAALHLDLAFGYVTNMMGEHDRGDAVSQAAEACAAQ